MLKEIKVNTKALETMLFVWASVKDREKVSDLFLDELANIANGTLEKFISNRERLNGPTKKESRFWNYNMWMLEDPGMTDMMLAPIKTLNVNEVKDQVSKEFPYESVEVIFYPGQLEISQQIDNKIYINFFVVKADLYDETKITIEDVDLKEYVINKIKEMK